MSVVIAEVYTAVSALLLLVRLNGQICDACERCSVLPSVRSLMVRWLYLEN